MRILEASAPSVIDDEIHLKRAQYRYTYRYICCSCYSYCAWKSPKKHWMLPPPPLHIYTICIYTYCFLLLVLCARESSKKHWMPPPPLPPRASISLCAVATCSAHESKSRAGVLRGNARDRVLAVPAPVKGVHEGEPGAPLPPIHLAHRRCVVLQPVAGRGLVQLPELGRVSVAVCCAGGLSRLPLAEVVQRRPPCRFELNRVAHLVTISCQH